MGSFSIWHWFIVLIVVVLVFGTGKLKNLGGDLGSALKGFKDAMKDEKKDDAPSSKVESVTHKTESTETENIKKENDKV